MGLVLWRPRLKGQGSGWEPLDSPLAERMWQVLVGSVLAAVTGSLNRRLRGQGIESGAKKLGCMSLLSARRWIAQLKATQNTFWRKFSGDDGVWVFSLLIKPSPASRAIPGETESPKTHGLPGAAKGDSATERDFGLVQKGVLNNRPFHQAPITWASGDGGERCGAAGTLPAFWTGRPGWQQGL